MIETVLQSIDYRGYRLIKIRREIPANPENVIHIRWRITHLDGKIENTVVEVMSEHDAKAKVNGLLGK